MLIRRFLALILVVSLWFGLSPTASADAARLAPGSEVPAFNQRLDSELKGMEGQLQKYDSNIQEALSGDLSNRKGNIQSVAADLQANFVRLYRQRSTLYLVT